MQYCKSSRKIIETVEDLMGRLRIMAANCRYKGTDRYVKEQLNISGLNDDGIVVKIIREVTETSDTSLVTMSLHGKK